jgi:hypothetical protein
LASIGSSPILFTVGGLDLEGAFEVVQDRQDVLHQIHGGELGVFQPVALRPAPRVIEFRARPQHAIVEVRLFSRELVALGRDCRKLAFQGLGRQIAVGLRTLRRHIGHIRIGVLVIH